MKINNTDKEIYKSKFINYIKKHFIDIKINKFFEIISNYPDSNQTIYDIKYCFSNFNKNKFINTIKNQLENRLLTPGISTRLIIEIFIRIIKIMKTIESSGYLLEKISKPIKEYLRNRKDTMQWIVTTILSEDDNNLIEDMSKAYVRNIQSLDYDYMSSDDEPENWEPIRNIKEINNTNNNNNINNNNISETKKNKSDIISTLVNVFGSPEKFMEQYKRMLSERKVTNNKFSIENEIKNLELLKIKFGENLLNSCDVIIKDIKESKKLNSNELKNNLIDCLIINKNYWPFLNNNIFDINDISSVYKEDIPETKYDIFLKEVKEHINNYKKNFSKKNFSRELTLNSNLG
jgi:anaphase-promoting complex subunit 2